MRMRDVPNGFRTGSLAVAVMFLILFSASFLPSTIQDVPAAREGEVAPAEAAPLSGSKCRDPDRVLITGAYPDTVWPEAGGVIPDEFVVISNDGGSPASLSGWSISDGEGEAFFPVGASIPAGGSLHVTANGSAFLGNMGEPADFEWHDTDPGTPDMVLSGNLWLANLGDEMMLRDAGMQEVDMVAWGDGEHNDAGWSEGARSQRGRGGDAEQGRRAR